MSLKQKAIDALKESSIDVSILKRRQLCEIHDEILKYRSLFNLKIGRRSYYVGGLYDKLSERLKRIVRNLRDPIEVNLDQGRLTFIWDYDDDIGYNRNVEFITRNNRSLSLYKTWVPITRTETIYQYEHSQSAWDVDIDMIYIPIQFKDGYTVAEIIYSSCGTELSPGADIRVTFFSSKLSRLDALLLDPVYMRF